MSPHKPNGMPDDHQPHAEKEVGVHHRFDKRSIIRAYRNLHLTGKDLEYILFHGAQRANLTEFEVPFVDGLVVTHEKIKKEGEQALVLLHNALWVTFDACELLALRSIDEIFFDKGLTTTQEVVYRVISLELHSLEISSSALFKRACINGRLYAQPHDRATRDVCEGIESVSFTIAVVSRGQCWSRDAVAMRLANSEREVAQTFNWKVFDRKQPWHGAWESGLHEVRSLESDLSLYDDHQHHEFKYRQSKKKRSKKIRVKTREGRHS